MGGPSGGKCSALNCKGSHSMQLSLFRYPQDPLLRAKWVKNLGRPNWKPSKGARVCELHFTSGQIVNGRLIRDAVPGEMPKIVCTCKPWRVTQAVHDHRYSSQAFIHCKLHGQLVMPKLRSQINAVFNESCKLVQELHHLKKQVITKEKEVEEKENRQRRGNKKFTAKDIRNGLQLKVACGPSGYRKVLEVLRSSPNSPQMPGVRTLQAAIEHIRFAPGILNEIMEPLAKKFEGFLDSRDRDINIVFDELVVKRQVDYDSNLKRMIGYGTLPGQEEMYAEKGEIYMFRGIHQRLKQVVAYHLNPAEVAVVAKKNLIVELLQKANDIKANVIAIVCDMGNRGLLKELGFSTLKDSLRWRIDNPVKPGSNLWCVADPVHLFKSLKECFVHNKYIQLPAHICAEFGLVNEFGQVNDIVDLHHIEWIESFQRDDILQLIPGLTLKALNPNHFSKMKVKAALKVINHRTAAVLQYLVVKGLVEPEYETTAWFLKLMNRWFQLMTSRNLYHALGLKDRKVYDEAIAHLKLVVCVFRNMIVPGGWKPVQSHVILSTMAVLEIQEHLIHEKGYQFLKTSTFGCDVVENANSWIRMNHPNPTPLEFKNRLKHLTVSQFNMKINSSSYDHDGSGDYVDLLFYPPAESPDEAVEVDPSKFKWSEQVTGIESHEEDVLYRISGYIIITLKNKNMLKCEGCIEKLKHCDENLHPNSLFQILTDFVPGAQFSVSDRVFKLFRLIEFNLRNWLPKLSGVKNLESLIDVIVKPRTAHISLHTCHNVREKLVKAFTIMRYRQLAVSQLSPDVKNTASSLASKSAGGHYLAENYRQKERESNSRQQEKESSCRQKEKESSSSQKEKDSNVSTPQRKTAVSLGVKRLKLLG